MTRTKRAAKSCVNHTAIAQLCAETIAKSQSNHPYELAPLRDPIQKGSLAYRALELMRKHDPPRDYVRENEITKAKIAEREARRRSRRLSKNQHK